MTAINIDYVRLPDCDTTKGPHAAVAVVSNMDDVLLFDLSSASVRKSFKGMVVGQVYAIPTVDAGEGRRSLTGAALPAPSGLRSVGAVGAEEKVVSTYRVSENPTVPGVYSVLVNLHGTTHPRPGVPSDPELFAYFDGCGSWSTWEFSKAAALRARDANFRGVRPWREIKPLDDSELWKAWWYAALYGAGSRMRMLAVDRMREAQS